MSQSNEGNGAGGRGHDLEPTFNNVYGPVMSMALDPRERLWRETIGTKVADLIRHLEADPSTLGRLTAGEIDYAESLARAADLMQAEATRAGAPPAEPTPASAAEPATNGNGTKIDPDKLYTAEDAAPLIGVASRTAYRMGREKKIKVTRTGPKGGNTRFRGADIIEYRASCTTG